MKDITVYLPREDFRLIKQQFDIILEGISSFFYFKKIDNSLGKFKNPQKEFYICSRNAFYDQIILSWCKIFGSYNEPCHYTKILTCTLIKEFLIEIQNDLLNKKNLLVYLLSGSGQDLIKYEQYHRDTKKYRDQYLIHREHAIDKVSDGDIHFPLASTAENIMSEYYLLLIRILEKYPKNKSTKCTNQFYFNPIFDDISELHEYLQKSLNNILE